jgi:hypothetical protein
VYLTMLNWWEKRIKPGGGGEGGRGSEDGSVR